MRLIDADDLYQKCIEIQLKKKNRYFDIDDVIKLIKKAPTVDVLDKISTEIEQYQSDFDEHGTEYDRTAWQAYNRCLKIIDKYKAESEEA